MIREFIDARDKYIIVKEADDYYVYQSANKLKTAEGDEVKTTYLPVAERIIKDLEKYGTENKGIESALNWKILADKYLRENEKVKDDYLAQTDWTCLAYDDETWMETFGKWSERKEEIEAWIGRCKPMQKAALSEIADNYSINIAYVLADTMEKYSGDEMDDELIRIATLVTRRNRNIALNDFIRDIDTFELFYSSAMTEEPDAAEADKKGEIEDAIEPVAHETTEIPVESTEIPAESTEIFDNPYSGISKLENVEVDSDKVPESEEVPELEEVTESEEIPELEEVPELENVSELEKISEPKEVSESADQNPENLVTLVTDFNGLDISLAVLAGRGYFHYTNGIIDKNQPAGTQIKNYIGGDFTYVDHSDSDEYGLADNIPSRCWVKRIVDDSNPNMCYLICFDWVDGKTDSIKCVVEDTKREPVDENTPANYIPQVFKFYAEVSEATGKVLEELNMLKKGRCIKYDRSFAGIKIPQKMAENGKNGQGYTYIVQSAFRPAFMYVNVLTDENDRINDFYYTTYRYTGVDPSKLTEKPRVLDDRADESLDLLLYMIDMYSDEEYKEYSKIISDENETPEAPAEAENTVAVDEPEMHAIEAEDTVAVQETETPTEQITEEVEDEKSTESVLESISDEDDDDYNVEVMDDEIETEIPVERVLTDEFSTENVPTEETTVVDRTLPDYTPEAQPVETNVEIPLFEEDLVTGEPILEENPEDEYEQAVAAYNVKGKENNQLEYASENIGSSVFSEALEKSNAPIIDSRLSRTIVGSVANYMNKVNIIKDVELKDIEEDNGILEDMLNFHLESEEVLAIISSGEDVYLAVCGMHALGAGMYLALLEKETGRTMAELSNSEINEITELFRIRDAYELGLNAMNIGLESKNKIILDKIILNGRDTLLEVKADKAMDKINIRTYMKAMMRAGYTAANR